MFKLSLVCVRHLQLSLVSYKHNIYCSKSTHPLLIYCIWRHNVYVGLCAVSVSYISNEEIHPKPYLTKWQYLMIMLELTKNRNVLPPKHSGHVGISNKVTQNNANRYTEENSQQTSKIQINLHVRFDSVHRKHKFPKMKY